MGFPNIQLDDKYTRKSGRIFLTGIQALVRLLLLQSERDRAAGLNTAGFVSGYRGSPLGSVDQQLWRARHLLDPLNIKFQPGVNEDLGATAVWGSQQVNLYPGAKYDGVFGMWYGKNPGVDRSGDVFKHANAAGTSRFGGVLAIAGDDPACKSSTLPSQSDYAFMDAMMPVLNPANVQEILDLGIYGWEMSRYSGCWVAMKVITENADASASVEVHPERMRIATPMDLVLPEDGLHIRWPDKPLAQEMRLQKYKLYAALAFARANRIDRVVLDSSRPRFGIVTTGKAYLDVMQALEDLGIDQALADQIGLRVYKVGMVWPLEREGIREFAEGLEEILVVEEKRAVIENQLKEQLYNWREDVRPRVLGKFNEQREWILPSAGELTPARIARVIAARIGNYFTSDTINARLAFLKAKEAALAKPRQLVDRVPHYCSGCPHNTSTRVPEGSRAMGGIGCHYMVTWMDRETSTFTHMGGEGVTWVGQAPFTETPHVFQNLGDGTYFHSGTLAIRAAIAAKVNITYKILYNDAVAMTGGQPIDGTLTVQQMTHQLYGEGVRRIAVVGDEPDKYPDRNAFAEEVTFHHRRELEQLQKSLRLHPGVSVLIYDQTCAAEKRRRRKRGKLPDPDKRVFINADVCEGCGDCSTTSNCLSIIPLETPLGRKRAINQSACNKDFTCVDGFCPSFVTVHGGSLRKRRGAGEVSFPQLPEPVLPTINNTFDIMVTGVGGSGVVTVGALLGMAAHIDGKGVSVLDQTGLAQKFGAVISHIRIAEQTDAIHAVRIQAGGAELLIGCDLVVAASFDALAKLNPASSCAVINSAMDMPAGFVRDRDLPFPTEAMVQAVRDAAVEGGTHLVDATALATTLLGDAIATNLFMVGHAYQHGLVPLSAASIEAAIELNGVAIEFNKAAFLWGRRAAFDAQAVARIAGVGKEVTVSLPETLAQRIERRYQHLVAYQDVAYAARYRERVDSVLGAEQVLNSGNALTAAVAESYHRVLAFKDEFEVARLYTEGDFQQRVDAEFEGDFRLRFHLAPPLLSRRDPISGHLIKREYGSWIWPVMRLLARCKKWRGRKLDPFARTEDRLLDLQMLSDYEQSLERVLAGLSKNNLSVAVEIASLPMQVRGFGHIKAAAYAEAVARREALLATFVALGRPKAA
jgi:indolepyruvate ferredoxin oxidoreductase